MLPQSLTFHSEMGKNKTNFKHTLSHELVYFIVTTVFIWIINWFFYI